MSDIEKKLETREDLNKELLELRREQFNLRIQQATGQLTRNHEHRRVRKSIARIKTAINQIKK
ncbi:MAG: 50S ribosomal protein L29 [Woeseiaceae bacterium]|jgi:large subunit ribosomal protein L29|nr:50S ribosomal protein L29 [Woeseiaceae bacterium]|tara:strand:+ start:343 stop:531 length:189 start_codon:yes stop_codon:yes gene_type:complete